MRFAILSGRGVPGCWQSPGIFNLWRVKQFPAPSAIAKFMGSSAHASNVA